MNAGVAALLGALVGGIASFGAAWWAERGQLRRDGQSRRHAEVKEREARDREREKELRIAARVVREELTWAQRRLELAATNGRYWSGRYALEERCWLGYRDQLAAGIDRPVEWATLASAYRAVHTEERYAARGRNPDNPKSRGRLGDESKERIAADLAVIGDALQVLQRISGDTAVPMAPSDLESTE